MLIVVLKVVDLLKVLVVLLRYSFYISHEGLVLEVQAPVLLIVVDFRLVLWWRLLLVC
jgi:hypothetical protein